MGLNSNYTAVMGNMLMMTPFLSLIKAYSLLVQEERERQVELRYIFLVAILL